MRRLSSALDLAKNGEVKAVLKKAGANADLRDRSGRSALDMAGNHAVRKALMPKK